MKSKMLTQMPFKAWNRQNRQHGSCHPDHLLIEQRMGRTSLHFVKCSIALVNALNPDTSLPVCQVVSVAEIISELSYDVALGVSCVLILRP